MDIRLTVTVLVENTPVEDFRSEHGLSLHLCYERNRQTTTMLLDFGQSDAFARNAEVLGIDLAAVDLAVLSHAHYDHADGMATFFERNDHAPLLLSETCAENCWSTKAGTAEAHYIGIAPELLGFWQHRLRRVSHTRVTALAPGISLVPHTTPNLDAVGARAGMLRHEGDRWLPDDFSHELTLVFELAGGALGLFSSCSHAGLPLIVQEVREAFPGRDIAVYVGGLHLGHASDTDILAVADAVRAARIWRLCIGHCTGSHASELLRQTLGELVEPLAPGATLRL